MPPRRLQYDIPPDADMNDLAYRLSEAPRNLRIAGP